MTCLKLFSNMNHNRPVTWYNINFNWDVLWPPPLLFWMAGKCLNPRQKTIWRGSRLNSTQTGRMHRFLWIYNSLLKRKKPNILHINAGYFRLFSFNAPCLPSWTPEKYAKIHTQKVLSLKWWGKEFFSKKLYFYQPRSGWV